MPSNKIITVFILCIGIVISVWLFSKKSKVVNENPVLQNTVVVSGDKLIKIEGSKNDDWKKILTKVDQKNQIVTDLTKNNTSGEDDTTLTDQLSRDFLSQYLVAVKEGIKVTPEIADKMAQNTLSLPQYTPNQGVLYIRENIKIAPKNDALAHNQYRDNINEILKSVYTGVKDDPMVILVNALQTQNEDGLKKLDVIININKSSIKYLLNIKVPEGAIKYHLQLLNISSQILADLEAMRTAISDPVRSFPVISQYNKHLNSYQVVLSNMNIYLSKNTTQL